MALYRFRRPAKFTVVFLTLLVLLASEVTAAAIRNAPSTSKTVLRARDVGNLSVGSDIYGTGVRVGFYLQGFTFNINIFSKSTRRGTLISASAIVAAILSSLTVLISQSAISPAETLVVINIMQFALLPGTLALLTIDAGGQGLGILLFVIDTIWNSVLMTWFWAKGYMSLPLLNTPNAGFFYVRVSIDSWLRTVSIVFLSIAWVGELLFLVLGIYLIYRSVSWYLSGGGGDGKDNSEIVEYLAGTAPFSAVSFLFFTLPLLVVASERMIQWNELTPNNDLSAPGQIIPLAIGVVGLVDSLLMVGRKCFLGGHDDDDEN